MEKLRTRRILEYLRRRKSCSLAELMEKFNVSSATIHRDVEELARRDAVERVRGGLIYNEASPTPQNASNFSERVVANRQGKCTAARKALAVIREGDIIFLDSSTTVYELALLLKDSPLEHLTIVTNSIAVTQNFRKYPPQWVLIALGGNYDPQLNSTLGAAALEQLGRFNLTRAFVSAFGIDEKNVTTNHERQAEIIHRVLASAEKRYLLADKSKFGRTGLYRLSARGGFDAIFSG